VVAIEVAVVTYVATTMEGFTVVVAADMVAVVTKYRAKSAARPGTMHFAATNASTPTTMVRRSMRIQLPWSTM
jgi:hypothetical protein